MHTATRTDAAPDERLDALPAFESVYAEHVELVFRLLLRLGVRRADAEDVCQEVFVTVHQKLAGFEGRSSLRTWVCGIAFRAASEHRRRAWVRREQPTRSPDASSTDESTPLEALERAERRALLEGILESLDDEKRAVFVLYEIEGLSMKEVCAVVECPLQTGYTRLHAARDLVTKAVRRLRAREG